MKLGSLRNCLPGAGCLARPDSPIALITLNDSWKMFLVHKTIFTIFIPSFWQFSDDNSRCARHDTQYWDYVWTNIQIESLSEQRCRVQSALLRLRRSDVTADTSLAQSGYGHRHASQLVLAMNSFFIEISIVCLLIVMLRRGPLDPSLVC